MKTDIRKMIAEAYELEGLLLLADNRGADTPEYVFTAIGEKLDRLQMLLGEREDDEGEETQKDACMVENDVADAGSEEPVADAPESEELEPEPEEDVAEVTAEQVADGEYDNEQEPMVELVLDDEPTAEPDAETPNVADETEAVEAEDNIEEETEANEKASDDSEPLRLDEKLQRSRSKDLKSAFSLNDTFRFGNSAAEMTDALHVVEAMHSFDEAEDYFYGDLGWDRESDDVKEFMAIIKNHFL